MTFQPYFLLIHMQSEALRFCGASQVMDVCLWKVLRALGKQDSEVNGF
jgi:hypothetical protein